MVIDIATGVVLILAGIWLTIRSREVAVVIQNYYANMRARQKRAWRGRLAWLAWPGFVPSAVQARAMGLLLGVGSVVLGAFFVFQSL